MTYGYNIDNHISRLKALEREMNMAMDDTPYHEEKVKLKNMVMQVKLKRFEIELEAETKHEQR